MGVQVLCLCCSSSSEADCPGSSTGSAEPGSPFVIRCPGAISSGMVFVDLGNDPSSMDEEEKEEVEEEELEE